jgi:hypothetical protein
MRQAMFIALLALANFSAAADRSPGTDDKAAQDALVKCLQETATHFAEKCMGSGCAPNRLDGTIGLAQRTRCGYSAAPGQAPQAIPPEPLLKCLRQTAMDATLACEKGGCLPDSIFFIIGAAQKSRCGYTAFERMELPASAAPTGILANCFSSPTAKGEWITSCTGSN